MSRSALEYLRHISDELEYLIRQTKTLKYQDFFKDETLQKAFVRSLEVIGEATKKIPDDFKGKHDQIEWKAMAGMRDKLIHDYFGIDYEIVWDVVINKAPRLHKKVQAMLQKEDPE
jgi:uncharacterized protein with HEPN domain